MAFPAQLVFTVQIELLLSERLIAAWTREAGRMEGLAVVLDVWHIRVGQRYVTLGAFLCVEHAVALLVVVVAVVFVNGLTYGVKKAGVFV